MSDYKEPPPDLRANRRKEVFRATRGSKLTGQRGRWAGAPAQVPPESGKVVVDDGPKSMRRVRLGGMVEDEAGAAGASDPRRYSEPND
jgi:hypothetical protein